MIFKDFFIDGAHYDDDDDDDDDDVTIVERILST